MPNPYVLAALALLVALSGVLGYRHGVDTERGRAAIAQQKAVADAAEASRADTAAESDRRQETALRDARTAAAARERKLRGQIDALSADRPDCRWPEPRRVLLNAAVAAANGTAEAAAVRVPDQLPNAPGSGQQ